MTASEGSTTNNANSYRNEAVQRRPSDVAEQPQARSRPRGSRPT